MGVNAKRIILPFLMRSTPTEQAAASGTGTLTHTIPANCNVGDRLFIYAHKATSTGAFTAPASPAFTLVTANAAGSDRAHLYTRVVDGSEGSTVAGPSLDVSNARVEFCFVYPPCTIEQESNLAVTSSTTIVGDDFTTNPSAAATILGCGGTNDTASISYTATSGGTLDAENSVTGVSGYVMHVPGVTTAPGSSVWQGADRATTGSVQKGAVVCYLVPS